MKLIFENEIAVITDENDIEDYACNMGTCILDDKLFELYAEVYHQILE
jgi:hypothetical protein